MRLKVFYGDTHIGNLDTTSKRGVVFSYTEDAYAPISISMPDLSRAYTEKECLPFFEGLLPEGEIRRQIADFAHVPATSTIKLLEQYGADIAGALVITGEKEYESGEFGYAEITADEISKKISQKSRIPMILSGERIRLSLAGAENKIPVRYKEGRYYLPVGTAASSHIIKATDEFVDNEFICNRLAFHCGLDVPQMEVVDFSGKTALLITRYDREVSPEGDVERLHQEDFCQALGVLSRKKYEENGGPGLRSSIALIQNNSEDPSKDMRSFIGITVFNYMIGNCDAHAKNYSFLYDKELKRKHLAPFYDIVCSSIYDQFDKSLAMRIGKERELGRITRSDFESIASKKLVSDVIDCIVLLYDSAQNEVRNEIDVSMYPLLDKIVEDSIPRLKRLISNRQLD